MGNTQALDSVSATIQKSAKKLEQSDLLDNLCGIEQEPRRHHKERRGNSNSYDEDYSEEDETLFSETDTMDDSSKYTKESSYTKESASYSKDDSHYHHQNHPPPPSQQPLASSFAKRCYFTKAGIGKTTCHYEGLTLTGNVVLMLAQAMKLKGCPTICDEDLRRVEQTYPNQFSRLPDELLLSSGWRRISKYCHFSNKPIPDGIPFFHSRERVHPSGGYYFLLAAAVGMIRPMDVEPLTRDTLVLLETDYSEKCDALPSQLIQDASQWMLVDKFCFFSGGPINDQEDVYYQAVLDGNWIYMLAFLSPSLTPQELYKLNSPEVELKTIQQVQAVEQVYDLQERDFDDLKLYHLGPCRALPPFVLQPSAWTKILPRYFLWAKEEAMRRAYDYQMETFGKVEEGFGIMTMNGGNNAQVMNGVGMQQQMMNGGYGAEPLQYYGQQQQPSPMQQQPHPSPMMQQQQQHPSPSMMQQQQQQPHLYPSPQQQQQPPMQPVLQQQHQESLQPKNFAPVQQHPSNNSFQREVEEEGAFIADAPQDEAIASRGAAGKGLQQQQPIVTTSSRGKPLAPRPPPANSSGLDPPEDEQQPPSLSPRSTSVSRKSTSEFDSRASEFDSRASEFDSRAASEFADSRQDDEFVVQEHHYKEPSPRHYSSKEPSPRHQYESSPHHYKEPSPRHEPSPHHYKEPSPRHEPSPHHYKEPSPRHEPSPHHYKEPSPRHEPSPHHYKEQPSPHYKEPSPRHEPSPHYKEPSPHYKEEPSPHYKEPSPRHEYNEPSPHYKEEPSPRHYESPHDDLKEEDSPSHHDYESPHHFNKEVSPTEEESFSPEDEPQHPMDDGYAYRDAEFVQEENEFGQETSWDKEQNESWARAQEEEDSWNQPQEPSQQPPEEEDSWANKEDMQQEGSWNASSQPEDSWDAQPIASASDSFSELPPHPSIDEGNSSTFSPGSTPRHEEPSIVLSPADESSAGDSFLSGSSVWTDNTNNNLNSRRALILQMAKARMKSQQSKQQRKAARGEGVDDSVGELD